MPRCLHKRGILRVSHLVAINQKLVEVNPPLRLLIKPAPVGPEDKRPRRNHNELFFKRFLSGGQLRIGGSLILFGRPRLSFIRSGYRPSKNRNDGQAGGKQHHQKKNHFESRFEHADTDYLTTTSASMSFAQRKPTVMSCRHGFD